MNSHLSFHDPIRQMIMEYVEAVGDHDFKGEKDIAKIDFSKLVPPDRLYESDYRWWFNKVFAEQNVDSSIRTTILKIISENIKNLGNINNIHGLKMKIK